MLAKYWQIKKSIIFSTNNCLIENCIKKYSITNPASEVIDMSVGRLLQICVESFLYNPSYESSIVWSICISLQPKMCREIRQFISYRNFIVGPLPPNFQLTKCETVQNKQFNRHFASDACKTSLLQNIGL